MLPQVELAGLRRGHGRPSELAETHVTYLDRSADPIRGQGALEVRERRDRHAVEIDDEVAHRESGALGRSARDHLEDSDARGVGDPELVRELTTDRRRGAADPEICPADPAIANQH